MNMKKPRPSAAPQATNDSMRRVQIGVAGVMAVLLLVGLAGLVGDRAREQVANDATVKTAPMVSGVTDKQASAALEELGVQPKTTPIDGQAPTAAPVAKAAPLPPSAVKVPDLEPDPELQRARDKSAQ